MCVCVCGGGGGSEDRKPVGKLIWDNFNFVAPPVLSRQFWKNYKIGREERRGVQPPIYLLWLYASAIGVRKGLENLFPFLAAKSKKLKNSCARYTCKTSCIDKFQRFTILPMVVNFNLYTMQFQIWKTFWKTFWKISCKM